MKKEVLRASKNFSLNSKFYLFKKSIFAFFLLFLSSCGGNYHLSAILGGQVASLDVSAPITYNTPQPLNGSCSPSGSAIVVNSPDMVPPSVTTTCASGTFVTPSVVFNGGGPNALNPVITSSITPPGGSPSAPVSTVAVIDLPAPVITLPSNGDTLSDNTPTVVGTAEPGATVNVTAGGSSCSAIADAAGNYTCVLGPALPDGPVSLVATQTDPFGNASPASPLTNIVIDTTAAAPLITAPTGGVITTDSTPNVVGTAEPGATVNVTSGGSTCSAVADASGNWNCDLGPALPDGPHTVSATQTDLLGNVSPTSPLENFVVDTGVLAPVLVGPVDNSVINDNTPNVNGTGEPGATVSVSSGTSSCTALVDALGNWNCNLGPALLDGPHSISATQTDVAGHVSPADTHNITLDTSAPNAVIASTETGPTNANPIPVSITFDEDMDVASIALTDFTVGNGTASNLSCTGSPTVCTIDVTPTADGNVTVDLALNLTDDLAGNGNNAAAQFSILSDTTAPVGPITASTSPASPTSDPNADLNIDCGVDAANGTVVVTTNPANGFTPNYGTTETLDANGQLVLNAITWSPGTYDILLACSDEAGNGPSSPTTPPSVTIDNVAPTPVIASTETGPTNANPIPVSITFDEDMDLSTIALTDFTVGNGTASNLSCAGSPTVCTIDVTPTADGNVTVDLAANLSDDLAGNGNNAAAQFSILSDTTAPVGPITASTSPASPTSDTNADLNIDCGLDAANGTVVVTTNPANGFTPNYGTTETLDANGQLVLNAITWSPGTYDILLACSDEAGNGPSSPTTPPSVTIDNVAPTPVIASTETGPTNANPIPVSITFDEDMDLSTIALTDFTVGNGTASNLNCTGSPTVCTIDVTPTADGNVTVDLAANLTDDLAGNGNTAATQFSIISDSSAPTPVIASTTTGPTNANPIPVSITFDEDMDLSTIALTDFTVGNGTASNLNCTGSPTVCTIDVTPTADGNVTVDLAANLSDDLAGNGNNAAAQFSILSDTTAPVGPITASTSPASPTSDTNADLNIDCGLDAANGTVVVTTNPANGFTPNYGTTETLDANGQLVLNAITWSPGTYDILLACSDEAGNGPSSPTTPPSVTIDNVAPTPVIASTETGPTNANPIPVSITFDEDMDLSTIALTDFTVGNGTASNLNCTGSPTVCTIDVTPTADGNVTVDLAANLTDDLAGNGNTAATQFSIISDSNAPTPVIASTETGPTNANPIPVSITFDEDMDLSTIALTDFTVGNGTASNLNCTGSPTVCTIDVTPTADGNVTVDLAANLSDDLAGNGNNAAVQFSILSDTTAPVGPITASTSPASPTSDVNADLNIDCGVDAANGTVVVTTNPANGFTPNYGTTETLDANGQLILNAITWSPGTYDILLACSDAAGNGPSSPTTPPSVTINSSAPNAVISSTETGPTNANPIPVTITFDQNMDLSTIALSDFTIGNGTASNLSCAGSPTVCTIDVTPTMDGSVTVDLAANQADDLGGNGNNAATQFSILSDTTAPTVALTGPASGTYINAASESAFAVSGTCSEIGEDVTLNGISGTTLVGQPVIVTCAFGNTWNANLDFTGNSDGTVNVSIDHSDTAGNSATQDTENFILDTTAPAPGPITASTSPGSPTNDTGADLNIDCGTDSANGTVVVTTNPANGFTPNYGTTETLDANGQLVLNAITWSPGTYDILLACSDAAGNGPSSPATPPSVTIDTTAPTVAVEQQTGQADPATSLPVFFDVVFNEAIDASSFVGTDITFSGTAPGTPSYTITNPSSDNMNFVVEVAGFTGSGTVVISLAAGVVDDLAGNANVASTSSDNSVQYNHPAPTLVCGAPALTACSATVTAACSGAPAGTFQSGSGTSGDPYIICTVQQLQDMNTNLSAHYQLGMDIDASSTSSWSTGTSGTGFIPIGGCIGYDCASNGKTPFTGSLDGDGYKICDLFIDRNRQTVGLFGLLENVASVTDISIVDADIENDRVGTFDPAYDGYPYTEVVTGILAGGMYNADKVSGVGIKGTVNGTNLVGGLAGMNVGNSLSGYTWANVNVDTIVRGSDHVGGVFGAVTQHYDMDYSNLCITTDTRAQSNVGGAIGGTYMGSSGNFSGITVNGHVESYATSGDANIGGIFGSLYSYSHNFRIEKMRNNAQVTGASGTTAQNFGGIVGLSNPRATSGDILVAEWVEIKESSNHGDISGGYKVGGIIGSNENYEKNEAWYIDNSYSTGAVSGLDIIGGLVGQSEHWTTYGNEVSPPPISRARNSFNTGTVTATKAGAYAGGLVGASQSEIYDYDYGYYYSNIWFQNSFNTGNVNADNDGGLLGRIIPRSLFINLGSKYLSSSASQCIGNKATACTTEPTASYFYDIDNAPMTSWDFTASGPWDPANDDIDYPTLK